MIRFLIHRPIAVLMAFTAFFILGIITYLNIPVSLLPNIAIPEITIQVTSNNSSARELENSAVSPIRRQLLQIGKLKDIRSETRDGSAVIKLSFEYGVNTDLAFIEVNEKIDAAMNYLPKEISRPKVIKASATDIPVFNLNLTLKEKGENDINAFLDLCEFSESVIKRRIEQLPQVAMVDVTGLMNKQIQIVPDENTMKVSGITHSDIESALKNNNVDPGNMVIKDGYYEYIINFSSVMRTVEDVANTYIRKNGKIYQLKDIARVEMVPEKENGVAYYNGKRAVTMAIIKQTSENMGKMQAALNGVIENLSKNYPDIEFNISQNQTQLLDYTISNLQQNLILAFIFVWLVSALFMNDVRSPLIIGLSMFVSLIICLLFFYLFHVTFNVISLTGLVLALGMMIDSSIIVTDNIRQYQNKNYSLDEACIMGTNEVIAPMLSSSLTTISVFVPLIFLSGIAGALFFDQAFSVTVGLLVSYATGIVLLPVLYKLIYSIKVPRIFSSIKNPFFKKIKDKSGTVPVHERIYSICISWIFRHKTLTAFIMIIVFPVCALLFVIIPKEKMPDISQTELLAKIEWNQNIHLNENIARTNNFLKFVEDKTVENSALIGQQQFLLNSEKEQTSSESEIYFRVLLPENLEEMKKITRRYFNDKYPDAIVTFSPVGTIFERIFVTGEPDLTIEYYTRETDKVPTSENIRSIKKYLVKETGYIPDGISFQKQLNLHIDKERLLLYNISYNNIYQILKSSFKGNEITLLRSYQQYLPIMLGGDENKVEDVINNTLISVNGSNQVPLSSFVSISQSEDVKTIVAGRNGEYLPFNFYDVNDPEEVVRTVKKNVTADDQWDVDFSGSYFSNRKMLGELMIILFISILLMYFILAAQFESFMQPLIVLLEIPIDIAAALGLLIILGHSLNLMSAIGIIVTCGIIINDSILKVDIMNQLRRSGMRLMDAIHEAGRRRLNAILMTSLTSIVCMAPLLFSHDMGSELEKPLALATIGGMVIGTPVSLFVVPLVYWWIYRKKENFRNDK
ncbi:efflux RND transporter permease subunit [Coprobacter tertius]|uniref:Efflux RND transporter permease subunit n=1 Tax=Coprobacter tertius TaxID=2944915 RepID=A0ABT1MGP8_9BACT|nr:efflux RND transporter permease subunit [Coprobacter tertius]MCP9611808.1 efflux RND transporter permease subunit [Coprobacter tertius]